MARPTKDGIEYFPFDVDFHDDDKVALITAEFGVVGESILLRLLCKIYKHGYFYSWGEEERLLFCRWAGGIFNIEQVDAVVEGCLKRNLFDRQIFNEYGVLTSRGIQRRFLRAVVERKRVEITPEFWLIEIPKGEKYTINRLNNSINPTNNDSNTDEQPPKNNSNSDDAPSKKHIKYSTVKYSKEKNIYPYQDIVDLWNSMCPTFPQVIKISQARKDKIRIRLEEFGDESVWMPTLKTLFAKMNASKFLRGDKTEWKASFDWLFGNSNNWVKVIEGNYDDKDGNGDNTLGYDERIENGRRTYGTGKVTVPADAPPRPSASWWWNDNLKQWNM